MEPVPLTQARMAKQQEAEKVFQSFERSGERMGKYCGRLRAAYEKLLEAEGFFAEQTPTDGDCLRTQKAIQRLEELLLSCVPLIATLDRYEQPELREDAQAWVRRMERRAEIVRGWAEVRKQ